MTEEKKDDGWKPMMEIESRKGEPIILVFDGKKVEADTPPDGSEIVVTPENVEVIEKSILEQIAFLSENRTGTASGVGSVADVGYVAPPEVDLKGELEKVQTYKEDELKQKIEEKLDFIRTNFPELAHIKVAGAVESESEHPAQVAKLTIQALKDECPSKVKIEILGVVDDRAAHGSKEEQTQKMVDLLRDNTTEYPVDENETTWGNGQTALGSEALPAQTKEPSVLITANTEGDGQTALGVDALPCATEEPAPESRQLVGMEEGSNKEELGYIKNVTLSDVQFIRDRRDIPELLRRMNAQRIAEVGVCECTHFRNLITPESIVHAVAVDIWQETGIRSHNDCLTPQHELERMYRQAMKLAEEDHRVEVVRDYSPLAAERFPDGYFDFVYIDDDHTEEGVTISLNAWWPKVRPGGVIAGHDYFEYTFGKVKFGIIPAVTKFRADRCLKIHVDNEMVGDLPAHDWYMPKPAK